MTDPAVYVARNRATMARAPIAREPVADGAFKAAESPATVVHGESAWRKHEAEVLRDMDLVARWRAKLVPRAPGWTRSAGDTSKSAEDHARKVDVDPVHAFDESDDAQRKRENADERGRQCDARLTAMPHDAAWQALEAAVSGLGTNTTMSTADLVGLAMLTKEIRGSIRMREWDRRKDHRCIRCGHNDPSTASSWCESCTKRDAKGQDHGEVAESLARLRKGGMLAATCARLGREPWWAAVAAWRGIVVVTRKSADEYRGTEQ